MALVLAIDQGTSSTKCLAVDAHGVVVARGQAPVAIATPAPGSVQQSAVEIWASVGKAVGEAMAGLDSSQVVAVGLSTQRESCLVWDRRSGEPLTPVLSWQDQRTESLCAALKPHAATIRRKSGLPLDPMFSAAKARWLLDHMPARDPADICIGTIDAFLLSRFGGEAVVEAGNASRTQLFNVVAGGWDDELLDIFGLSAASLPRITASNGPFPAVRGLPPLRDGTPVGAVLADSHAALFAHGAFAPGPVKATHGTGSSIMGLVGGASDGDAGGPGLCLTLAWKLDKPALAFEGNIRSAGATLVWAADLMGVSPQALADLAAGATAEGVHIVPAFGGLGAPWWDAGACATISGLSFGPSRAALARAALDSIAHQIADVVDAFRASGAPVERLLVDGGPTRNDQLMQFEADMVGAPVERTAVAELSAMGAAHLAGLTAGLWNWNALARFERGAERFAPRLPAEARATERQAWARAVRRARGLAVD